MRKALGISVVLHASAVLAAGATWLQTDLPWVPTISWGSLDCSPAPPVLVTWPAGALDVGLRPEAVRAFFGDSMAHELQEPDQGTYCWRYAFAGGNHFTLLFERGAIAKTWFSDSKDIPPECQGGLSRLVPLEGTARSFGFGVTGDPLGPFCLPTM